MNKGNDYLRIVKTDPLLAADLCQAEIAQYEKGHWEKTWYYISVGYGIARNLIHDYKEWMKFTKKSFWKHRTKRLRGKDIHRALLHSMVYVFSATTRTSYDRAHDYATALEHFFNNAIAPEKIPALIKENGGVEGLLKKAAERRKRENFIKKVSDPGYFDDAGPSDDSYYDDEPTNAQREARDGTAKPTQARRMRSPSKPNPNDQAELRPFLLAAVPDLRRQILSLESGEGGWIQVVRGTRKYEHGGRVTAFIRGDA